MNFKDLIRFVSAKTLLRKTVLFSRQDDWEPQIRNKIKKTRYTPFFYEFNEVSPRHFDLVVPLTLKAEHCINTEFPDLIGKKVLSPSEIAIQLCDDKEMFTAHLISHGFSQYVPKTSDNLDYPYILKKKTGLWGLDIAIIHGPECEQKYSEWLASDDYFRQEYVTGSDEYTTHIIMKDGEIKFSRTLKFTYREEFFVKGNNFKDTKRELVDHTQYSELFQNILNTLDYEGICCFNYKLCNDKVKIFEVNPRYGGSLTAFLTDALPLYETSIHGGA